MKFASCFIQGAALALLAGMGSTFGFAGSKLGKDMHDAVMMGYSSDLALDPGHFKAVMDSPKFGSPQAETVDVGREPPFFYCTDAYQTDSQPG